MKTEKVPDLELGSPTGREALTLQGRMVRISWPAIREIAAEPLNIRNPGDADANIALARILVAVHDGRVTDIDRAPPRSL